VRDLTPEELKLAPDWATHYFIDTSDNTPIYESENLCWWVGLGEPLHCRMMDEGAIAINRKTFDITQHEWSDKMANLAAIMSDRGDVVIRVGSSWIFLDKQDGIAIAKALGLTADDLK